MNILLLIITAGAGALIGYLVTLVFAKNLGNQAETKKSLQETQNRLNQTEAEKSQIEKSLIEKQTLLNQITEEKQEQDKEVQKLRADNVQLEKSLSSLKAEQKSWHSLQEQSKEHFKNLSQEILSVKSQQFHTQATQDIQRLLNPLKEKVEGFQKKVEETYHHESRERFSLKNEIKALCDVHEKQTTETQRLSKALKGDIKAQGQWGEMILSAVLSASGLKENEHYTTQGKSFNLKDEEGKRQKPDVIVKLPDNKHIVIDSKLSLTHYEQFISASTEEQKQLYVSQFTASLRTHILDLHKKQYNLSSSLNTPDFVLMFFPIEGAFSLAMQSDPKLFAFSWDRSIVIVSPTTLLATLKTVESIWKRDKQNKNAIEIAEVSGALYDKFTLFTESLSEVGDCLKKAENSWITARDRLKTGRGSIVSKLEKIKHLGAQAKKQIPENLLPPPSV